MTAYMKNYSTDEEKESYQRQLKKFENIGWLREIPEPYQVITGEATPESLQRKRIEQEEMMKDRGDARMFGLFAEASEDLYTGIVDRYVRKTPGVWEEFAQRLPTGEMYLVDPDPYALTPRVPTSDNICLDIQSNLKFSPRLCLWAIESILFLVLLQNLRALVGGLC